MSFYDDELYSSDSEWTRVVASTDAGTEPAERWETTMSETEEDQLRRCLHLTMRSYVNGKLDESKPCLHWECVERNKAADRIEELEQALDEMIAEQARKTLEGLDE